MTPWKPRKYSTQGMHWLDLLAMEAEQRKHIMEEEMSPRVKRLLEEFG